MKKYFIFVLTGFFLASGPLWALDNDLDGFDESEDCNDTDDTIYPGADEFCADEGIDNDCDGDENDALDAEVYYEDDDDDGYGGADSVSACSQPVGYTSVPGDCDDEGSGRNPGLDEVCGDDIDNDCGEEDEDCDDDDCSSTEACLAPSTETACSDGADDDLDGLTDCDDADCEADAACETVDPTVEDCDNGSDDDGDVLVDCDDADCDSDAACEAVPFNELESSNDTVDFETLSAGETVSLSAPDPRRAALVKAALPSSCSCGWGLDDASLASFSDSSACETVLTPEAAGEGLITVVVDCGGDGEGSYRQSFTVTAASGNGNEASGTAGASGCALKGQSTFSGWGILGLVFSIFTIRSFAFSLRE